MNKTCLHFWRLLRRVMRREPGALALLNVHMNGCTICREYEQTIPECYAEEERG